ncbi:MAG: HPF/RaiA family ribosome-associated protein [Myxococcota bacterium]
MGSKEEAMDIQLRVIDYAYTEALNGFANTSMSRALGRHVEDVASVTVTLRDLNGPRGGVDQCAKATIRLRHSARALTVQCIAEDAYGALRSVSSKARTAVRRALEKRKAA